MYFEMPDSMKVSDFAACRSAANLLRAQDLLVLLPRRLRCLNVSVSASSFSERSERLSRFVASRFWNRQGGSGKWPEQSAKSPSWQRWRKCVSLDKVFSEKFSDLCSLRVCPVYDNWIFQHRWPQINPYLVLSWNWVLFFCCALF